MSGRDVIHCPLDVPLHCQYPCSCFGLSLYSSHNLFLKFLLFSSLYTSVQQLGAQPLLFPCWDTTLFLKDVIILLAAFAPGCRAA